MLSGAEVDRKVLTHHATYAVGEYFQRISQVVKRMLVRRGHDLIVVFQDDFLIIGRDYDECLEAWLVAINLLLKLGFEINYGKLVAPTVCLVFLGIQLDSESCEISLPAEKIRDLRQLLDSYAARSRATKRQLQTLAGKLNFASRVVRGGRTFLRRILNCIQRLRRPSHKAKISGALKDDIAWWQQYMHCFNGVAAFADHLHITPILTDACIKAGGAFCNGDFKYVNWEVDLPHCSMMPINYKEAMIAVRAVIQWAPYLANRKIYVYTDNQCAAAIINKCACKNETLMIAIRQMFWVTARNDCVVKALYMPGDKHILADSISRLHEPGQLLHVEALLNEWWLCHKGLDNGFAYYSLANHMSLSALCSLLPQVEKWQTLRRRWIVTWTGTDGPPTRSQPRPCTGLNYEPT